MTAREFAQGVQIPGTTWRIVPPLLPRKFVRSLKFCGVSKTKSMISQSVLSAALSARMDSDSMNGSREK